MEREKEFGQIVSISEDEDDLEDFQMKSQGHIRTASSVLHKIDEKLRKGQTPMQVHL